MIKKTGFLLFSLVFLLSVTSLAQTDEKSQNRTDGIKEIGSGFQLFSEGKLGNTLYKENRKIVARQDLILHTAIEAPDGFIYYGTNEADEPVLGFAGLESVIFNALEGGYYELVTSDGKRKLYRLTREGIIQNLLPRSNTASGLVYNQTDKAAFYHIAKGETIEVEEGKQAFQYTFRIHVVKDDDSNVIHLPETVSDLKPKLRLNWIDKNTLQFTLSSNQKETIIIE